MGLTNFPDGVRVGTDAGGTAQLRIGAAVITPLSYEAVAASRMVAGTVIVPAGGSGTAFTVAGLSTITYVAASPWYTVEPVVGYSGAAASHSGGTITLRGYGGAGTASLISGTATWIAIGT